MSPVLLYLSLLYSKLGGGDFRLIYRHYATLYFVFCVDSSESELGVLDLIQVQCVIMMCHQVLTCPHAHPHTHVCTHTPTHTHVHTHAHPHTHMYAHARTHTHTHVRTHTHTHTQVFVETLDRCFENVCELDLIFHMDKVHNILSEICIGGMVLETNMSEILVHVDAQSKLEKSESSPTSTIKVD